MNPDEIDFEEQKMLAEQERLADKETEKWNKNKKIKKKILVIIGYLLSSIAVMTPWLLTWYIGNGKIPSIKLTVLSFIIWFIYIVGMQIITWDADIELRILRNKVENNELDLQTGQKFNELINKNPISEEELLSISETVAKFVAMTRLTDIDKYLFDKDGKPRKI
jgi:hypothetical protein